MINVFQEPFHVRLKSWHDMRESIKELPILEQCIRIDSWWQYAPLVNHYLHPLDISMWPSDPWQLLSDNVYCEIARGLGMCYTLRFMGINDIRMVQANDVQGYEVFLVLVNNAKYILNYYPNTILNNKLQDFSIIRDLKFNMEKNNEGNRLE